MKSQENVCKCACGAQDFYVRFKRAEQVGMLTCADGHHSLLLDARDYWADVLQSGRPRIMRCRCGGKLFRVNLAYEFRESGDVRKVEIGFICMGCERTQTPVVIDVKYTPTDELVSRPLDPIDQPWLQPKRREITAFWKPADAEDFATFLVLSLRARVFTESTPYRFTQVELSDIKFYPELRHDLLFTNLQDVTAPRQSDPENSSPFLRLKAPFHMVYSLPMDFKFTECVRLLHYIRYAEQVVRNGVIEEQPSRFLALARDASDWLARTYISLRGKNTADNPEEYSLVMQDRSRS